MNVDINPIENERLIVRDPPRLLRWFGDAPAQKPKWLVRKLLPERGVAMIAGQFGSGKTFVAGDLSVAVMSGASFAGFEICRTGGVLWLAAEGEDEIEARIQGVVRAKMPDRSDTKLPFARQVFEVPSLTGKNALADLRGLADEAKEHLEREFNVQLVLIVIDTMGAAAGFLDENSASETQGVMNTLASLSRETGALVVPIDHFGKNVETGVRGSSAKGAAADAILAVLAERDTEGNFSNRRMAVNKLRGGPTGRVVSFDLKAIDLGDEETTCFVDWREGGIAALAKKDAGSPWKGHSKILRKAISAVMTGDNALIKPFADGPSVRAVSRKAVRAEFFAAYPAPDSDQEKANATKRQAFGRLITTAVAENLVGSREVNDVEWLWFVKQDDEPPLK